MQFRLFIGLWIASWLALIAGGLLVWSDLGLSLARHVLAAIAFALPLSVVPTVGALMGMVIRRRQPDRGRGLACWLATGITFWVAVTAFPMQRMRILKIEVASEAGEPFAVIAGIGAVASILWILNGLLYFAEPRRGLRRAAVVGMIGATLVLAITIPVIAANAFLLTPSLTMVFCALALPGGQSLLLLTLLALAATRWVKAGFAEDSRKAPETSLGGSTQS